MSRKKLLQSRPKGAALALMLIALVMSFVMGVGLLRLGLQSRVYGARTSADIAARCAADAAMTKAVFEMNEKLKVQPWDDSVLPQATDKTLLNCDEIFSYTVTGDVNSGYIIESIGKSGQAERRASSTLRLQTPFEYAVFALQSIYMENGTVVDWYNYDADDRNLQIGTNSTEPGSIIIKSGATVNGDVVVGVGGNPDVVIDAAWATITGRTYAATGNYEFPPVIVPEQLQQSTSQGAIKNIKKDMTITCSGKYDEINLGNGEVITINGQVTLYITGDIIIKNSARIEVVDANTNPDAYLILYLGGNVEVKYNGAINNLTEEAKKIKIYGLDGCQSIHLKNSTTFYGTIYAPNANVTFDNSADAFGSVAAKVFEQKNSAAFHYDASLRDASADDGGLCFVVEQWQEE